MALTTEEAKRRQKDRAGKYKIEIKEGGHVTKAAECVHLNDDEFADPVNYRCPIDQAHIRAAARYWGKEENRALYTEAEQAIVTERIDEALKRYKVGPYSENSAMGPAMPFAQGEAPKEPPSIIQLCPLGYHYRGSRPFYLAPEDIPTIIANFEAWPPDVVIDYEHGTHRQGEQGLKAPAAAWIGKLIDGGERGLLAEIKEWTPEGTYHVLEKEYRYVSPVFLLDENEHAQELLSVGLTNFPGVPIDPVMNRNNQTGKEEKVMDELMKKLRTLFGLNDKAGEDDIYTAAETSVNRMDPVRKELGLADDATDDQVLDAVKVSVNRIAHPEVLKLLKLDDKAGVTEVTGKIVTLQNSSENRGDVGTRIEQLEKDAKDRRRDELVDRAKKEGKITANQMDWAKKMAGDDPAGFEKFLESAPVVVNTRELGNEHVDTGSGDALIDEGQASVNRQLGISEETFKKHNKPATV